MTGVSAWRPGGSVSGFTPDKREKAEALAREGWSVREICRQVGTNHHNVRPIVASIEARGERPTNCACGQPRGPRHHRCDASPTNPPRPKRKPGPVAGTAGYDRVTVREIERRAGNGHSGRRIAAEMGLSLVAVQKRVRQWLATRGSDVKPCKCGRPARHPGGCIRNSPSLMSIDRAERIRRWAREGLSAAEMGRRSRKIADTSGIHTILKYAVPVWEAMADEGIFCGCGDRRGHRGLCIATWESAGRIRGPQPIPVQLQRRIANALLNGDSMNAIRLGVEASWKQVLRVYRAMSPEERHRRACRVRRRIGDDDGRKHGLDLYERIQHLVPKGIDKSLRDEVVSELCLAVIQGDVSIDTIRAKVKTFVGRAFTTWASSFQRSADEHLGDDDSRTIGEMLGDETMVEEMDGVMIGAADSQRIALAASVRPARSREEVLALDVLRLGADATIEDAKAAWRRLVKESHPDAQLAESPSSRQFMAVQAAWDILRKADEARTGAPL